MSEIVDLFLVFRLATWQVAFASLEAIVEELQRPARLRKMKPPQLLLTGLIAVFGIYLSEAEDEVLPWDALNSEKQMRAAVEKRFPGLQFGFYQWSGDWVIGALEDFDNHRIFLFLPAEGVGEAKISRNGKELALPPGEAATLRVAGGLVTPDGTVSNPETAFDRRIGYWIPLEATDRMSLSMKLSYPSEGFFEASYDPDAGWKIACRWEVAKQDRKEAADAYEIGRPPLLDRVLEVLKDKENCRIRMKDGFELTISEWTDDKAAGDPLFVTLSDKIAVGWVEPGENKSLAETEQELKSYQAAARSAGESARVLVRFGTETTDGVFRTALKALANEGFAKVGITQSLIGREKRNDPEDSTGLPEDSLESGIEGKEEHKSRMQPEPR
jgi:hypothetical protein